jgi:hypothetical protein
MRVHHLRRSIVLAVCAFALVSACKSSDDGESTGSSSSSGGASSSGGTGDGGTRGDAEVPKPSRETKTLTCNADPCVCEANQDCSQSCAVAGCDMSCQDTSACSADCKPDGAGCAQTCEKGADCTFDCTAGSCAQTCKAGSTCKLTCAGGKCNMTCEAGATCEADCTLTNDCTCTGVKC